MKSGLRALDDFPCVTVPSNARDCQYQVLGFELTAALRAFVTSHAYGLMPLIIIVNIIMLLYM